MILSLLADQWRFLTFRSPRRLVEHRRALLVLGLAFAWLAGVGRYWDNPRAALWQHLGLGSVIYVFVLAAILWILLMPLKPRNWSYGNVLLFVALTAPPAVLYAIPVERFMSGDAARATNAWFLGAVAAWRVALLIAFLRRSAKLSAAAVVVGCLLPLVLIVVALTLLNLEHVAFELMSGIAEDARSPNDLAYQVVLVLSLFSIYAAPVLVIAYLVLIARAWSRPVASG